MNERRLWSHCRRLLRDLDVQPPLDITELCARVGAYRGREIRVVAVPLKRFGVSFDAGTCDVIAVQSHTSRPHQDHICCHELGHIVCGHLDPGHPYQEDDVADADETHDAAVVAPLLPFDGMPRRLRRSCYDSPYERAVELIATTFMEWAAVPGCAPQPTSPGFEESRSLQLALSYRRGWL